MGCCVSCRKAPSSDSAPMNHSHGFEVSGGRDCHLVEVEAVKEVLSVTPTLEPVLRLNPEKEAREPVMAGSERADEIEKIIISNAEIRSLSESFSTATVAGKTDENEEVNQKRHSFSTATVTKRNALVGKSPTARSDQSPARGHHGGVASARIEQNRDSGGAMVRRNMKPELRRGDPGEKLAKRSRSPSTARIQTGANRSSDVRSGRSPSQKEAEEPVNRCHETTNESLENPLVSLECFIFL